MYRNPRISLFFFATVFVFSFATLKSNAEDWKLKKRTLRNGKPVISAEHWDPSQCAVIVCDMWDSHHCFNAVQRVKEMAPRMDQLLKAMRDKGATIIHAPSSCTSFYQKHPARLNALSIPRASKIPDGIGNWCDHIEAEKDYPLDQSDGGEDDDPDRHQKWAEELKASGRNPRAPWKRQIDLLTISNNDFISDQGEEIWSILESRKINNVMLVGVHTNMCVLGRPFGLRQLSQNGKNVVLVRDLTDAMYNPARWPFVDHFQGNRLIQRHIEKYVCGTITSDQILGGKPFRFQGDRPKKCLVLCAESLYETDLTLKEFQREVIQDRLGLDCQMLIASKGQHQFPDKMVSLVQAADVLVLSVRRRALPTGQLEAIRKHLSKGKPMVALRTSSHAFDTRGKHAKGHAEWAEFDAEILGCNYTGHYANDLVCKLSPLKSHPILTNVELKQSLGSLYQSNPLASGTTELVEGQVEGHAPEPVAWTREKGKSRVFYTSLGHPTDFDSPAFVQLMENAVRWSLRMKIGVEPERKK